MIDGQDHSRPQRPGTTTAIPALGITFAEAFERWHELRRQENATAARGTEEADDAATSINDQHGAIMAAVLQTPPQTPADAAVILRMVADDELGIGVEMGHDAPMVEALSRAAALIGPMLDGESDDAAILETFDRWRTACLEFDAELPRLGEEHPRIVALTKTITDADEFILATPARSIPGLVVKLITAALDQLETADQHEHVIHGTPLPTDARDRCVWEVIDALWAMVATAPADHAHAAPAQAPHPDAELLEAFARLLVVIEEGDSPEMVAEERAVFQIITTSPAHTLAGVLVKLEWLTNCAWGFGEEGPEMVAVLRTLEEAAGRMGHPIAEAIRRTVQNTRSLARMLNEARKDAANAARDDDERTVLDAMRNIDKRTRADFVKAITAFRQMHRAAIVAEMLELFAGRMHAEAKRMPEAMASARAAIADMRELMSRQPDQPQDADPFGAAVAQFEQAAPSILPAVPSAVMVEAGAAAAGIDATTVRALYAAMAQAHQQERAA